MENSRRDFIKKSSLLGLGVIAASNMGMAASLLETNNHTPSFTLEPLPYPADALEPYIDSLTMQIHHGKHHNAYVTNLNNAIKDLDHFPEDLLEVFKTIQRYPASIRNNAGGHWNHTFFWNILRPGKENNQPIGNLANAINADFGSFDNFKAAFKKEASGRFGSGWAWLVVNNKGKLEIISTPNQDNPYMLKKAGKPIIGLDVWEHAYYLKYQNKRADYIDNFWAIVNWDAAEVHYNAK